MRASTDTEEQLGARIRSTNRTSKLTEKGEAQRFAMEKSKRRRDLLPKPKLVHNNNNKENQNPLKGQSKLTSRKQYERVDIDEETPRSDEEEYTVYQHKHMAEQISFQGTEYPEPNVGAHHINSKCQTGDMGDRSDDSGAEIDSLQQTQRKRKLGPRPDIDNGSTPLPVEQSISSEDSTSRHNLIKRSRLVAKDLDEEEKEVLENAQEEFQMCVCTLYAFPECDPGEIKLWMEECWESANKKKGTQFKLTRPIQKLIRERVSTIRGRVRERAVFLVPGKYGFMLAADDTVIKANKDLAAKLLDNFGYIYKTNELSQNLDDRVGMYEHPVVAEIIARQFFNKKSHSSGIIFSAGFNPIPEKLIALVFTAVHFAIDQWKSGTYVQKGTFSEVEYHPIYQKHLEGIQKWKGFNQKTAQAFARYQAYLFEVGSKFAGVEWEVEDEEESDPFNRDCLAHAAAALD